MTLIRTRSILARTATALAALAGSPLIAQPAPVRPVAEPLVVEAWSTPADRRAALVPVVLAPPGPNDRPGGTPIVVDDRQSFQEIDGFGFALTGGSAQLIHAMPPAERRALLRRLFTSGGDGIGISTLRLTVGASDMNAFVYSYDDLPAGETDPELKRFSLGHDRDDVLPVLKEILAIQPKLRLIASPWSAPAWMKTNGRVKGGALKPEYYGTYANYFVRYVEAMRREGVRIDALTIQNEPLNYKNTPSMVMSWQDQAQFIREHLGPAFAAARIDTKILLFDHNTDRPDYPIAILNDPGAARYVAGSAFHNYRGDMSAMSIVHAARPDKDLFFTEQMVVEPRDGTLGSLVGPVRRLVIGAMRNWSRDLILWNLAADPSFGPHTDDGGCPSCQGAVTIDGPRATFNIASYALAHAARFVPPGSVRIASTDAADPIGALSEDEERQAPDAAVAPGVTRVTAVAQAQVLPNVAFRTPDDRIVLVAANDGYARRMLSVQYQGRMATLPVEPGAVVTLQWPRVPVAAPAARRR